MKSRHAVREYGAETFVRVANCKSIAPRGPRRDRPRTCRPDSSWRERRGGTIEDGGRADGDAAVPGAGTSRLGADTAAVPHLEAGRRRGRAFRPAGREAG